MVGDTLRRGVRRIRWRRVVRWADWKAAEVTQNEAQLRGRHQFYFTPARRSHFAERRSLLASGGSAATQHTAPAHGSYYRAANTGSCDTESQTDGAANHCSRTRNGALNTQHSRRCGVQHALQENAQLSTHTAGGAAQRMVTVNDTDWHNSALHNAEN